MSDKEVFVERVRGAFLYMSQHRYYENRGMRSGTSETVRLSRRKLTKRIQLIRDSTHR